MISDSVSALVHGDVGPLILYGTISGTDDLSGIAQLFDAVGTPTGNTGNGENRCIQLLGKIQHTVNKAAEEVHVGADALVNLPLLGDNLGCKTATAAYRLYSSIRPFSSDRLLTKDSITFARGSDREYTA